MKKEIVILGCGLSGLITALSFAHYGIEVTIIEAKSLSSGDLFLDPRTTALSLKSTRWLNQIGLLDNILEISGAILDIYVVDNKSPSILHFDCLSDEADPMGYLVKNADFKQVLLKHAIQSPLVHIIDECDYSVEENNKDYCLLKLSNGEQIKKCDLVIACDGYKSKIRNHYFTPKLIKDYNQSAIVFNLSHSKTHECTAVEHFMSSGPFAILPLKDQNTSSIVWTVPTTLAQTLTHLDEEEFLYNVKSHFGEFLGELKLESAPLAFSLKAYLASNYYNNRIVLIADTAHVVHPLAGQGLNQGIKDIAVLSQLLVGGELSCIMSILSEYQSIRAPDNFMMYTITDKINAIFSNYSPIGRKIRMFGLSLMENGPGWLKQKMIKYAGGSF